MVCMMAGKCTVTIAFVKMNGHGGSVIQYKANLPTKRILWMTDRFKVAHFNLHKLIIDLVDSAGSKWSTLETFDQFRRETDRRQQGERRVWRTMEVIGLCTKSEKLESKDRLREIGPPTPTHAKHIRIIRSRVSRSGVTQS